MEHVISQIKTLKKWMGLMGLISMVWGSIAFSLGLAFTDTKFLLGVVPGAIAMFLGYKLMCARKAANQIICKKQVTTEDLSVLVNQLSTYFFSQFMICIVSFILIIGVTLVIALGGIALLALIGEVGP